MKLRSVFERRRFNWRAPRGRLGWTLAVASGVACVLALPPLFVWVYSWFVALPLVLAPNAPASTAPTIVRDRGGQILALVRSDGKLAQPVAYSDLPPHVVDALLAAEDKRFMQHSGVDWLAVGRACFQAVAARRIVSGASTLTQQLARSTFERARTLPGKVREMAVATRIERELTKQQIIEAYVNRVEFGPNVVGIGAASHAYFAKPVAGLSLSEAATLVGLPRGPALYNPERRTEKAQRRRDRVLRRLVENEPHYADAAARALELPLELQTGFIAPGGFHWVRRSIARATTPGDVATTLDSALQARVETLVKAQTKTLARFGASAASVLIAHNATGDVLAYVGSPDYFSETIRGQNDGVMAARQPGSTLKPFVYAAAMQRLNYTAATLLPDVPLEFREHGQIYAPRNYDGRFHGPVRLREALAGSLNVPAVHTASQLGVATLLGDLHTFGFSSLSQPPEHYGVALALGDGEVTLEELVTSYMMLANSGEFKPLRFDLGASTQAKRVVSAPVAAIIRDILQDPHARAASFGRHGALEFDYPVAVKTGTSKGARDNWTLGFSDTVTVGVWVGNFDGTPMLGASGASVAGPLFQELMNETVQWVQHNYPAATPRPLNGPPLRRVSVCERSGHLPNDACPSRIGEWFIPGTEPHQTDTLHVRAEVKHGALAPGCPDARTEVFERYDTPFVTWAKEAGRPLLPTQTWDDCSYKHRSEAKTRPTVVFPRSGAVYRLVADEPSARQQLVLRARASVQTLTFVVDGTPYRRVSVPFETEWPLATGEHEVLVVTPDGQRSDSVHFRVQ